MQQPSLAFRILESLVRALREPLTPTELAQLEHEMERIVSERGLGSMASPDSQPSFSYTRQAVRIAFIPSPPVRRKEYWTGWALFEADCLEKHVAYTSRIDFSIGCGPIPPDAF